MTLYDGELGNVLVWCWVLTREGLAISCWKSPQMNGGLAVHFQEKEKWVKVSHLGASFEICTHFLKCMFLSSEMLTD